MPEDILYPGWGPERASDQPEKITRHAELSGAEVLLSELPDSVEVKQLGSAMRVWVLALAMDGLGGFGVQYLPVVEAENAFHCGRGCPDQINHSIMRLEGGGIEEFPARSGGSPV